MKLGKTGQDEDLDVRALEFGEEGAGAREHGHVEAVAVRVADEDVAGVRHVDAVRKVGHRFAADAPQKVARLVEHHHTVAL